MVGDAAKDSDFPQLRRIGNGDFAPAKGSSSPAHVAITVNVA
jgi:hypothetical protein